MATLKIMAAEASKKAAIFNEEEAKRMAEQFDRDVQNILDKISDKIAEASEKGLFSIEFAYKEVKDLSKTVSCSEEILFIATRKEVNEVIIILRNGGFTASTHHDSTHNRDTIKIAWPDPEDEDSTK